MRKGTPDQLIAELENRIAELKGVDSSVQVIDDGEDVIEAGLLGEKLGQLDDFLTPSIPVSVQSETDVDLDEPVYDKDIVDFDENISDEYTTDLYDGVERELSDLVQSIAWTSDNNNIYMDVSFEDGHIFTFTIPKDDLMYDLESMDTDIEYICRAVRDSDDVTEESFDDVSPEDANYDMSDYYAEEDKPVYL